LTLSRYQTRDFSGEPEAIQNNETGSYMPIETRCAAVRIEGAYKPSVSGSHYMSFYALGPSQLFINDKLIFDITKNSDDPMGFLFGGVVEERSQVDFVKGQEYRVRVESIAPVSHPNSKETLSLLDGLLGVHLGFMTQETFEEDLLASAVEVAKSADVALVFVGNIASWETEGVMLFSSAISSKTACAIY
jgi:beta-glucosidase